MPLSWNEIRHNAIRFSKEWSSATRESAEKQTFWNEFFAVFGLRRRTVASFEEPVKRITGDYGYIDLFWPGTLIVEHKTAGKDLSQAESPRPSATSRTSPATLPAKKTFPATSSFPISTASPSTTSNPTNITLKKPPALRPTPPQSDQHHRIQPLRFTPPHPKASPSFAVTSSTPPPANTRFNLAALEYLGSWSTGEKEIAA
ncbi:MAG TPA: type IIL restriction-modification enzyme MmeI [Verrucomicrobiae bacterium]